MCCRLHVCIHRSLLQFQTVRFLTVPHNVHVYMYMYMHVHLYMYIHVHCISLSWRTWHFTDTHVHVHTFEHILGWCVGTCWPILSSFSMCNRVVFPALSRPKNTSLPLFFHSPGSVKRKGSWWLWNVVKGRT